MMKIFTLIKNKPLTKDVFELHFECGDTISMKPGQFVTFIIEDIGGRAYSILDISGNKIILIIKKRERENGGRGGSKFVCEQKIGSQFKGVGPSGHFILQKNHKNKLFIGTGTGLVPLYNQIIGSIKQKQACKLHLVFGVRTQKDLFYVDVFEELKKNNHHFDFSIFLSAEKHTSYHYGYVTQYLQKDHIKDFEEFYICGAPGMIDSTIHILNTLGISETNIFLERYF